MCHYLIQKCMEVTTVIHEDCVKQLQELKTCLIQELQAFDSIASALLKKNVFSLSQTLDNRQRETRIKLMVPAHLRRCLATLDSLLVQTTQYDHNRLIAEFRRMFVMPPKNASTEIPLSLLFADNIVVLSRKARQGVQADFCTDSHTNTLYIACLSEKTLGHLDGLYQELAKHAKRTIIEPTSDETNAPVSPKSSPGASPS